MEMDLSSALFGAIAIAICVLPIIILNRTKKKREEKFLQSLSKLAVQYNAQIHKHEILGSFAIGLDETKNSIFYHSTSKDKVVDQHVDLNEIQSCRVINTSRTIRNNDRNQKVIDKLELSFTPSTKSKPEIKLEFFNSDVSVQLSGELQSVEKWSKLINDRLKNNK